MDMDSNVGIRTERRRCFSCWWILSEIVMAVCFLVVGRIFSREFVYWNKFIALTHNSHAANNPITNSSCSSIVKSRDSKGLCLGAISDCHLCTRFFESFTFGQIINKDLVGVCREL